MALFIIGGALLIGYALLIAFYKKWWDRLETYNPAPVLNLQVKVSIIIAARNEAPNLDRLLSSLKAQTYSRHLFEVLLVDDHSTDDTAVLLQNEPFVNCLSLPEGVTSKKKAIQYGIENATGEVIVTTDADCWLPPNWLQTLVQFYVETDAVFIAAPVRYRYRNKLLDIFQTLDFLTLQGITAASVSSGFHTMCNGANLAYSRQAFLDVNGFEGIDQVASGDDMLLMHKIWKREPQKVFYLKNEAAMVETAPMPTWKQFFWQRIRWASKTTAYEDKRIFWALVLVYFFNLLFPVLVIVGFWHHGYWPFVLLLWLLKTVVELPFITSVAQFFQQPTLVKYFLFFQPLHILYTVLIGALSQTGSYQWKGRKTK
ncbi:MAG: glycosyltransferase [Flaviaesturariibacter sp.]|nr:glycosyltransferase [Flaviaesturariibacter sp.]